MALARELPPNFVLKYGSHNTPDAGMCLMEAVAFVAGEPHSDSPRCASPKLAAIGRSLNDRYTDDERQLLAPLIPRLVGTRTTLEHDRKRSCLMIDASIRGIAPMGLDAVGWSDLGDKLRAIAPVVDTASARAAHVVTQAVRGEAKNRYAAASASVSYAASAAEHASYAAITASYASASVSYAFASAFASEYASASVSYAASAAEHASYAAITASYAAEYASAAYAAAASVSYAASAAEHAADGAAFARGRSLARRPIVEATVRAFESAIDLAA
jgi:hypothetical protein